MEHAGSSYVFNGVSGAMVRLSQADAAGVEMFLDGDDEACSAATIEKLTLGRMLIADSTDELSLLRTRYQISRNDPTHLGLTLVTSLGCNFDCPYCFEAKHPSIMSIDVQQAVLQLVDDSLPNIKDLAVTWFGGEPLVGKRPLLALSDTLIDRCDRHGVEYRAAILTNGWLLDEQTCEQLRSRRVTSAQVVLDGPPDVHDRMRPLVGGKPSFWRIVENLRHAVDYMAVGVRMNVDAQNVDRAEELLQILQAEGLSGKLVVYPGQLVSYDDNLLAPAANYASRCFSNPEYAGVALRFQALATRYGFSPPSLPAPTATPCTAVRANEIVVGSEGELYKCWDDVGNPRNSIGNIRDYMNPNGRLARWLGYDPFSNEECRGCIALPVCMGGCAHHALNLHQYENRCGTFRHTYAEQVTAFAASAERDGDGRSQPITLIRRMETR
ncbi:MAG: SPASM domain-containing protein [Actinomycetota bacterium]|nr:SPASM domain-containing protein [Actinomycetota bacterium]